MAFESVWRLHGDSNRCHSTAKPAQRPAVDLRGSAKSPENRTPVGRRLVRRYPLGVTDDVLTLDGLRRRRPEILRVAQKRRAHRIAVFGSVARGEARPDSDLDLLVDFEPGTSS